MRLISLRNEEPPDDAIVVVRGGAMQSEFVVRTASDAHDEYGMFSVSVFLALDMTVEDLCAHEPHLARYGQVRLSTVGRLRAAGFALLPTLAHPHYDVILPDIERQTLHRLETCFAEPIPNPGRP
jgi:hypothetical protein